MTDRTGAMLFEGDKITITDDLLWHIDDYQKAVKEHNDASEALLKAISDNRAYTAPQEVLDRLEEAAADRERRGKYLADELLKLL
jgi:hypothetical protein